MAIEAFDRVELDGTGIDRITEAEVVAVVRDALDRRPRRPDRHPEHRHPAAGAGRPGGCARHLDDADLVVADGMPLVWASRLGGTPAARAGGRQQPDLVAVRRAWAATAGRSS